MITFRNFYQRNNLLFMCIFNRKKFIRIARQSDVYKRQVLDTLDSDGSISESQVETAKEIVDQTGADYLHLLPSPDLYLSLIHI